MRLEQLYYIVEVARQKSISKAAKNLYISQPSLSKAISQLENELDTPLFVRLQQGIIPTTTGELIIDKAQNILKEVADIKVLAENKPSLSNQNALRIALPLLLCNELLSQILQELHDNYPTLTILPYQSAATTSSTISATAHWIWASSAMVPMKKNLWRTP